jgi:GTP-binding protein
MFVDEVRIEVQAGHGGAGVVSFERRKGKPRGKATGGSGGRGGDVVIRATGEVGTLLAYARHPHHRADSGTHGEGDLRHGREGQDLVLAVPLGTVVRDEAGTMLADLVGPDQSVVVARGGRGGRGNAAFVSPRRKAPSFAEQGEFGEQAGVVLELKLVADAALIGFPNAGKSTLISRVSAARPKIADYPFTTLTPNLGVVSFDDREFVLADIPGLIEGAADGKGLGHEFLRHVERARVLIFLLDPSDVQQHTFEEQLGILERELAAHAAELAARPRLVALGKIDLVTDPAGPLAWAADRGMTIYPVSSVTGEGIERLMHAVADEVERHVREAPARPGYLLHRPLGRGFEVTRRDDAWVVSGRDAERAVALNDLTVPEAADFAARRLARIGVDEALRDAGAQPGDDVRIGDLTFTYEPEDEEATR